jgi:hypothetical protein
MKPRTIVPLPKFPSIVVVIDTALPCRSTMSMCVVPITSSCGSLA